MKYTDSLLTNVVSRSYIEAVFGALVIGYLKLVPEKYILIFRQLFFLI